MKQKTPQRVALVTGATRGLGQETARQLARQGLHVLLGARRAASAQDTLAGIAQAGGSAEIIELDVDDAASIAAAARAIASRHGRLDVLVNNAGVMRDGAWNGNTAASVSDATLKATFQTNFFGQVALTQALWPLLRRRGHASVVNVSSIMGSNTVHANPQGPLAGFKPFAYDASKAALNAFTTHLAEIGAADGIKVNSAHPGWVRTELGTDHAPLGVAEGAQTIVDLALLPADGPTAQFVHRGEPLPW